MFARIRHLRTGPEVRVSSRVLACPRASYWRTVWDYYRISGATNVFHFAIPTPGLAEDKLAMDGVPVSRVQTPEYLHSLLYPAGEENGSSSTKIESKSLFHDRPDEHVQRVPIVVYKCCAVRWTITRDISTLRND